MPATDGLKRRDAYMAHCAAATTPATDTNDQWLHIRPISITPHVREANARWQEAKPDSRLTREMADADYYDAEDQRDADAYAAARALMDAE